MFVVDFIAASVLALVLAVAFAALIRTSGYHGLGKLPARVWTMAITSWAVGVLLLGFGPAATGTHWLPFAFTGLVAGLLLVALPKFPKFNRAVHTETGEPGDDARPAIAVYFIVTVLLFFCAISARFYILHVA